MKFINFEFKKIKFLLFWLLPLLLFFTSQILSGQDNLSLKLPYEKGETHQLTCGYGCGGHTGEDYYALDFSQLKSRSPFKFY